MTSNFDADTVSVLLNNPGLCTVQNVSRKTLPIAKRTMARANCRVGRIRRVYSTTVKQGRVISQKPRFGAVLPGGGKVATSSSAADERTREQARRTRKRAGSRRLGGRRGAVRQVGAVVRAREELHREDSPTSVAIGDLNGDGRLDLANTNEGSGTVSVFLNEGDGSFQHKRSYGNGGDPKAVAVADLNGDRTLDLATANSGSNSVSVLLNIGDGSFADQAGLRNRQ